MLDEDTISQIRGSCDCDGGNWITKIVAKKIENVGLFFLSRFSSPNHPHTLPLPSQSSQCPHWAMKIAPKKSKMSVLFFPLRFSLPNHPHTLLLPSQSSQDPRWVTKIAPKKSKLSVDFFGAIFIIQPSNHSPPPPHHNHRRTLAGRQKSRRKNQKRRFDFFGAIFVTLPPSQSPQDPRICDIKSSSNIFGDSLIATTNLRVLQLQWEGRGMKIATEKIRNICRALKKCLKYGRYKSPSQLNKHQAAWTSRSTALAVQLAVWTRLYIHDQQCTIDIKNRIFGLPLPEYVRFSGAKLILNSTVIFGRER